MRNVRVQVAYDGSRFFGWQRQDGFESVQEALEDGLLSLTGEVRSVHGAGRTDTGVHALRQVAHVHLESALEDDRLRHAWNAHLVPGVVIRRLETCSDEFHARFDARGKRYLYAVATTRFRPPFGESFSHWIPQALNLRAMRAAARLLEGRHDFRAFGNAGSVRKTTVRTVRAVRIVPRRERFAIVVEGEGFLYNMVRTIAGSLIEVGRGRLAGESLTRALEQGERTDAGPTAPAAGLFLLRVLYPETPFRGADPGGRAAPGLFS